MANIKKMDAEFKIRCTLEEKELLKTSADEVGISMSDYARTLIFGKEKLVLLSGGSEIAKALFLIHTDLEYLRSNGGVPTEALNAMLHSLDEVAATLNKVAEKLTDIHSENKEKNGNE